MSRPKKKPNYDQKKIASDLLEAVAEAYQNPLSHVVDQNGTASLRAVADEFSMTPLKVRKLLITSGVYESETCDTVNELKKSGKTIAEIQQLTGLSRASVHGYLPYTKGIYKAEELSVDAERIRLYRVRQAAVKKLQETLEQGDRKTVERQLWDTIVVFENYPFMTSRKLRFHYTVKGGELFVDRKEKSKSITKSSVMLALESVLDQGRTITGPKKIGTFGASYVYAMFRRFGII